MHGMVDAKGGRYSAAIGTGLSDGKDSRTEDLTITHGRISPIR